MNYPQYIKGYCAAHFPEPQSSIHPSPAFSDTSWKGNCLNYSFLTVPSKYLPIMVLKFAVLLALLGLVAGQPPRGNGIDAQFFQGPVDAPPTLTPRGGPPSPTPIPCRRLRIRELNGRCTSRVNENFAKAMQAHFSYFDVDSTEFLDKGLKSPRVISNLVAAQEGDIFNDRDLNELTTFFGQFLDHNVASTPLSDEEMDIEPDVGDEEPLPFRRSNRTEVDGGERPVNVLPTAIDLVAVYGNNEIRNAGLRVPNSCLLRTSSGNLLPFNTGRLSNAPTSGPEFYVAGDTRSNEHPILTVLHTVWLREHNRLCAELGPQLPSLSGNQLYEEVRAVNIAQFQKVVYEEYFPALTGRTLGPFRGFRRRANPTLSSLFSTAAFRVGHTMVGNVISEIDEAGSVETKELSESFFVPDSVAGGIDPFMRGVTITRAQEIDVKVVNGLRNFLFQDIPEEEGPDLIALNLQRSRDHNIPSFNDVRREFRVRRARRFSDITSDPEVQARLAAAYDNVNDVEAWVGMMAEDHIEDSSFGITLFRVWEREFERLRDGDQFFYLGNRAFSRLLRREVPEVVSRIQDPSVKIFRDIILQNTGLIPPDVNEDVFKSAA